MDIDPASSAAPTLSVVVPVHGVEAYLRQCLDSILTGTPDEGGTTGRPLDGSAVPAGAGRRPDLEVIAVDDASPDGCAAILDEYARRDPRVRVVHLAANVGLGRARNAGLAQATGDYVWFVDGDDWLPPGAVAAVRARLAVSRPDVLVVDHAEVPEGGSARPPASAGALTGLPTPLRLADHPTLLRLAQSACTKVTRRAFLDEINLRFLPGWYEDCSYTHPLLMAAGSIDLLDQVCYHYRQRTSGGITRTVSPRHFDVFDQYERLFTLVDQADGAYEVFRPELFRLMINHYLVIVGNDRRLPARMRRDFFRRIAADYRRWAPAGGYPEPEGLAGVKHRLVRRDAYPAYRLLRQAHHTASGVRHLVRTGRRAAVTGTPTGTADARTPAAAATGDSRTPVTAG
ncbi:glycosyltransferase family 2 protein [Plantactinospora sonchi]|uniref:Glycosyltransferase n=1 Tax=Plantactinospora sonchi TaxID=1544735 RepID=A0ABU7RP63_9ACTN